MTDYDIRVLIAMDIGEFLARVLPSWEMKIDFGPTGHHLTQVPCVALCGGIDDEFEIVCFEAGIIIYSYICKYRHPKFCVDYCVDYLDLIINFIRKVLGYYQ